MGRIPTIGLKKSRYSALIFLKTINKNKPMAMDNRAAWLCTSFGTSLIFSQPKTTNKKSIHNTISVKKTKRFILIAAMKSPVKKACSVRCNPHPGQKNPVC